MFRPKGMKGNTYLKGVTDEGEIAWEAYEAGADAMLGALRKQTGKEWVDLQVKTNFKGNVVYIPDEE